MEAEEAREAGFLAVDVGVVVHVAITRMGSVEAFHPHIPLSRLLVLLATKTLNQIRLL